MTETIDTSMVMRCVAYQKGVGIGDVTIEDISEVLLREDTFIWLGLREANTEILREIQEEFGLHELAIEMKRTARTFVTKRPPAISAWANNRLR